MSGATTAAAIVGAGAIGAGASIYEGNQAAKAQEKAAQQATAAQQGFFNTSQQNLQPFIQTGTAAGNKIAELEGLNGGPPSSIQATLESLPGYQFANTQGLKSVQNQATQRGLGLSGAALKGAANYSTGLANEYYNNLLTGLQNTQNTGANAASGLANAAISTGSNIGSNITGAGNAAAGSDIRTGNAITSAASGIPTGLLTGQLLQQNANLGNQTSGIYNNINSGGNISNMFENEQNALYGIPIS